MELTHRVCILFLMVLQMGAMVGRSERVMAPTMCTGNQHGAHIGVWDTVNVVIPSDYTFPYKCSIQVQAHRYPQMLMFRIEPLDLFYASGACSWIQLQENNGHNTWTTVDTCTDFHSLVLRRGLNQLQIDYRNRSAEARTAANTTFTIVVTPIHYVTCAENIRGLVDPPPGDDFRPCNDESATEDCERWKREYGGYCPSHLEEICRQTCREDCSLQHRLKGMCVDFGRNCAEEAAAGDCRRKRVREDCPLTCGVCDSQLDGAYCMNHNVHCVSWATGGRCSEPDIATTCPRSCATCPELAKDSAHCCSYGAFQPHDHIEFEVCDLNRCMYRAHLCDGTVNCEDGSDEGVVCAAAQLTNTKWILIGGWILYSTKAWRQTHTIPV